MLAIFQRLMAPQWRLVVGSTCEAIAGQGHCQEPHVRIILPDSTSVKLFKEAMKLIEDSTSVNGSKCIEFVPRTTQKDYTNIEMLKE